jgi:hypothetical protein
VARWRSCVHVCCAWAGSHDRKLARPLTCARSPQGAIHPESCDSTWLDHARIFPRPEVRWAIQRFGGDAILTAAAAVPLPPARRLGRGRGVVPQVAGDQRKTRPARRHGHRLRQPRAHGADSRRRSSGAGVDHKVTGALYGWLIQGRAIFSPHSAVSEISVPKRTAKHPEGSAVPIGQGRGPDRRLGSRSSVFMRRTLPSPAASASPEGMGRSGSHSECLGTPPFGHESRCSQLCRYARSPASLTRFRRAAR